MSDEGARCIETKSGPVIVYTVTIIHTMVDGEWDMSVRFDDAGPSDDEQKRRLARDLREAADMVETRDWKQVS